MLEDRLKSVKNHGTNALILCLGVSALVPLVTHLGSAREQSETFIALACITVWVIRKLGYTVLTIINQQKTQYLWALHTSSRIHNVCSKDWHTQFKSMFRRKFFLVIGNKQCGKSQILSNTESTELKSSFEYQDKGLISHSVWSYKDHTILESTCLMPTNSDTQKLQANYWQNLLNIHKWHYSATGYNAIIIVLSIQSILNEKKSHPSQSIDALKSQVEHLTKSCSSTPLFFVLTGLDCLSGFHEFFKYIDKEDVDRPLGFTVPPSLQHHADIQLELDKVANDIESYLVYQLEKVALGDKNDVAKMHAFYEGFKALKPRIIQILYSLKTCIKNPTAGMFFTSHCEKKAHEHKIDAPSSAFYENHKQSYFHKTLMSTINSHCIWTPSRKIQQTALLFIILLSWSTSNLSIQQSIVVPLQHSVGYFFQGSAENQNAENEIQYIKSQTPKNPQPRHHLRKTQATTTTQGTAQSTQKKDQGLAIPISNKQANIKQDQLNRVWDIIKQTADAHINQCDLLRQVDCQRTALGLMSAKSAAAIDQTIIKALIKQPHAILSLINKVTENGVLPLNQEQLQEASYLIHKVQKNNVIDKNTPVTSTIIQSIDPNFYQKDALQQVKTAQDMSQQACQTLRRVHTIVPIPHFEPTTCEVRVQKDLSQQAFDQIINTYKTAMGAHVQNDNLASIQKKAEYLAKNTGVVAKSMQKISDELLSIEKQVETLNTARKTQYKMLLSEIKKFDEKTYKKVLLTVSQLSKEINLSRNAPGATQQLLEQLIIADSSGKVWPKPFPRLDQISQNTIKSLEDCIISQVSKYLDDQWVQTIAIPYNEEIKNYFPFNPDASKSIPLETFNDFFAYQGIISAFYNKNLHPLIETKKGAEPQWRKLHGKTLPLNPNTSAFIMGSTIIQKMYYPNNTPTLWFEGVLRYRHTHSEIQAVEIIQDNARQTIKINQTSPIHIKWPHAKDSFALAVVLKGGQRVQLVEEMGQWSMIKFLMKHSKPSSNPKVRIVRIDHPAYPVELEFETQSNMHPLSAAVQSFFQVPDHIAVQTNH